LLKVPRNYQVYQPVVVLHQQVQVPEHQLQQLMLKKVVLKKNQRKKKRRKQNPMRKEMIWALVYLIKLNKIQRKSSSNVPSYKFTLPSSFVFVTFVFVNVNVLLY